VAADTAGAGDRSDAAGGWGEGEAADVAVVAAEGDGKERAAAAAEGVAVLVLVLVSGRRRWAEEGMAGGGVRAIGSCAVSAGRESVLVRVAVEEEMCKSGNPSKNRGEGDATLLPGATLLSSSSRLVLLLLLRLTSSGLTAPGLRELHFTDLRRGVGVGWTGFPPPGEAAESIYDAKRDRYDRIQTRKVEWTPIRVLEWPTLDDATLTLADMTLLLPGIKLTLHLKSN
jgi:hypothetical protein